MIGSIVMALQAFIIAFLIDLAGYGIGMIALGVIGYFLTTFVIIADLFRNVFKK